MNNLQDLQTQTKELTKDNAKIQDLKNWSRSSNLRFVKIPESSEGCDILGFMPQLIPQLLERENFPTPPAI